MKTKGQRRQEDRRIARKKLNLSFDPSFKMKRNRNNDLIVSLVDGHNK